MKKVFKYSIDSYARTSRGAQWVPEFILELPGGAEILKADMQNGMPVIWAIVDPAMSNVERRFRLAGTGHEINSAGLRYIDTFFAGGLVMHLFELPL